MPNLAPQTFNVQALTPIWTGGPDQTCSMRIFETGLLGSLRWWLEACARGAGIQVPDPVTDNVKYDSKDRLSLDSVSRIFGATGWRRRFRLVVTGGKEWEIPPKIWINKREDPWNPAKKTIYTTYFYNGGRAWGNCFELQIRPIALWDSRYDRMSYKLFGDLLKLIAKYGVLGAKPQLGLGVVHVDECSFQEPGLAE